MKKIYMAALMAVSLGASAQTLNKEIVIEREIDPTLRAVSRLNNYPVLLQPEVSRPAISFSDMTTSVDIPGMLATLGPASAADAIAISPYRGYAVIGYFPTFNLGASAGYRIIEKPRTSLGIKMQYDGMAYKWHPVIGDNPNGDNLERNTVSAGIDFSHIFRKAGRLDINMDYTYNSLNRPWQSTGSTYRANAFNVEAVWSARKHDMIYFISGEFHNFGFNNIEHTPDLNVSPNLKKSTSQRIVSFKGGTSYFITPNSSIAGLASVDFVGYNHFNRLLFSDGLPESASSGLPMLIGGKGKTIGLITLQPSYRYHTHSFTTNIGVRAQITANSGKTFHIAPDISLSYRPFKALQADIRLSGGEKINRFQHLFNINPYMSPSIAYDLSHCPILGDASIEVGPFRGISLKLFGGYSAANDWLMPKLHMVPGSDIVSGNLVTFDAVNLTAWHYGAALGFKVGKIIEGEVEYTRSPGTYSHSYYLGYDRATGVLNVKLASHPTSRLTVDAGFEMRTGRSLAWGLGENTGDSMINLDNSNNLRLGANYAVFDWLSVYAQVENILGNDADDIWLARRQGVHGLIGASVKF